MGRKRRPKGRETNRRRQHTSSQGAMPPGHVLSSNSCERPPSLHTSSEHNTSDNALTAPGSILTTDEGDTDGMDHGMGTNCDDDDDDDVDMHSTYAPSRYPKTLDSHRIEMPYLAPESPAGNSDIAASTRSLWEADIDYRHIHGREYCKEWFMPIDEIEQLRGSLNHQVFLHVFEGEHSSVKLEDPTNILDIGTGTGEWTMRMAETYPECEVVGTDIAAVAETRMVPINAFFEIEDAEEWDRPDNFYDLIHFRSMEGAFRDWRAVYRNVFRSLKPGGWIELQDFDTAEGLNTFLGQFSSDSPIHTLLGDLDIAAQKSGRPRGNHHMNPHTFMDAGFVDVRVTEYMIPITVAEKSAGKIWLISCLDSLEASCLRLLTEQMGWDPDKCKADCEAAARELADLAKSPEKSSSMAIKVCVVVGRKPLDAVASNPSQTEQEGSSESSRSYVDHEPSMTEA